MVEKFFYSCVILIAAIFMVAIVNDYRKRSKKKCMKYNTMNEMYFKYFNYTPSMRFTRGNTVRIRPEYHAYIKKIIHDIGKDRITIKAFIDKIIEAYIVDNAQAIDDYYESVKRKEMGKE